jgi:hypothetical protein
MGATKGTSVSGVSMIRDRVFGSVVGTTRTCFEILSPKLEIRNKSKTQSKNVQNKDVFSHEQYSRRLVSNSACTGHPWRMVAIVLVI